MGHEPNENQLPKKNLSSALTLDLCDVIVMGSWERKKGSGPKVEEVLQLVECKTHGKFHDQILIVLLSTEKNFTHTLSVLFILQASRWSFVSSPTSSYMWEQQGHPCKNCP